MTHQTFSLSGMTCENCVKKITAALSAEPRIKSLRVTLAPPRAQFESEEKFSAEAIQRKLAPLGKYAVVADAEKAAEKSPPPSLRQYLPLVLLFGLSAGIPALNLALGRVDWHHWMYQFMGASLIALAYFKLVDLPRFAEAFATYDPIAGKASAYGYAYPFFELIAGIGLLLALEVRALSAFVILFLLPTTLGVILALAQKRKFQCACLGTAFNLPLTKVTIVENVLMMAMSAMILL